MYTFVSLSDFFFFKSRNKGHQNAACLLWSLLRHVEDTVAKNRGRRRLLGLFPMGSDRVSSEGLGEMNGRDAV